MSTVSKLPVTATLVWRAPRQYFFQPGVTPPGSSPEDLALEVREWIASFLQQRPSLGELHEEFNLDGSIDFEINSTLISNRYNEDLPAENNEKRLEMVVTVSGEMGASHGPGELRSWSTMEILDLLATDSDLDGDPERFQISVGYTK